MPLVSTHSFELKFECRQNSLATFLNALVGPKAPQFYTPRVIQIKNQKDRVPKADASNLGSAIPPPPPIVDPSGAPKGLAPVAPIKAVATYIVGEEQLEVTLSIGVVNFAPTTKRGCCRRTQTTTTPATRLGPRNQIRTNFPLFSDHHVGVRAGWHNGNCKRLHLIF